jgi:hypothetical protein
MDRERDEVEDDDAEEQLHNKGRARDGVANRADAEVDEHGPEHEHRESGGENGDAVPGDVGSEVRARR